MKHLKLSLLFLLCVLMAVPVSAKRKTKVIAHRGYWKTEGAAQNSIRSLERANEIKVYGSEFDVHLTADNVPVVYHDRKIEGKDIQTASYAELKDLKLSNGETLPTLEQYLDRAKKLKKTKLIFELKSHATPLRDREAAKIVVDMVNGKKLTKRTEYIAFSLEAAKELHRLSPKTPVYYLNGDLSPKQLKELGFAGLDYNYKVMQKHPEWFVEAKDLKLKINVWTVNDPQVMEEMIEKRVDRKIEGKDIQTASYAELKDLKLSNGETLPTLEQYLDRAKKLKKTKLIFELKSHATPLRDREAAKIVVDMVNGKKLTKRTEYIAFSLEAAKELHRLSPKTPVYYLNGDLSPKQLKELGFAGLDYNYKVMQKHPEWFVEAKDLKLKINVWTVNDPQVMEEMIEKRVDFLTTDYPEEAQKAVHLYR